MNKIRYINHFYQKGFSISELILIITTIGILATLLIPNFAASIEFIEVLIVEKKMLKAVKECQIGLINSKDYPNYSIPINNVSVPIFKNKGFIFSYTGLYGECSSKFGPNIIRASRSNPDNQNYRYSLMINLITGEREVEGQLPDWLDWWEGGLSPLIPKDDPLLDNFLLP